MAPPGGRIATGTEICEALICTSCVPSSSLYLGPMWLAISCAPLLSSVSAGRQDDQLAASPSFLESPPVVSTTASTPRVAMTTPIRPPSRKPKRLRKGEGSSGGGGAG